MTMKSEADVKNEDWIFREMETTDLDEIFDIENKSFTTPIQRRNFEKMLEGRKIYDIFPYVLEIKGSGVVGYVYGEKKESMIYWEEEEHEEHEDDSDDDENSEDCLDNLETIYYAHGNSIAIHPNHRRMGIGKYIMKEMLSLCAQMECKYITLDVSIFNLPAQKLYSSFGFEKSLSIHNFYESSSSTEVESKEEKPETENAMLGDHEGDALRMRLFVDKEFEKKWKMNEAIKAKNWEIREKKEMKELMLRKSKEKPSQTNEETGNLKQNE